MGKYVRNVECVTEFMGERVRAVLEPLDRASYMKLNMPMNNRPKDGETQEEATRRASIERTELAIEILTKHLQTIEGLTDAAGVAITKEEVLGKAIFIEEGLVKRLFEALTEAANMGKSTSGDSAAKSFAGTAAPAA